MTCTREPGVDCTTTCCRCQRCDLARRIHDHGEWEEFHQQRRNGYMQHYHKAERLRLTAQLHPDR